MSATRSPDRFRDFYGREDGFDSSNRLDDALEARLLEWENLYSHPNFVTTYADIQLPMDLSQSEKYLLAAQWLKDGLAGRKIDFPQSSLELWCFKFARSRATLTAFSIACFVHLTLPFLYPQLCPYEMATSGATVDFKARLFDDYPTVETLMAMEFLICIVYAIELASRLVVNNLENIKAKRLRYDMKDKWTTVRLVCVSAIFLELVAAFSHAFPFRFTFALIPVVYVSRRKNLRNMLQGMFIAMTQTYSIMLLLILTIGIWGYSGFLIFRNLDSVEKNRFATIYESVLTCLRVFASRTFSILAINPYYEQSHISAIFFVSLTIGADLLAGSLLIAVGTRAYRNFANQVYTRQMKKRRYAITAIHNLLAKDGYLQLSDWLRICAKVTGRYHLTRQSAKALFIYECANANDVCLDIRHFFRLVGLATGNIIISIDEDSDAFIIRETETKIKARTAIIISDKHKLSDAKPRGSLNFIKRLGTDSIRMSDGLSSGVVGNKSDFASEKGEIDQESLMRNRDPEVESMSERMTTESRSQHLVKQLAGKFREDETGNLEFVGADGRIRSSDSRDVTNSSRPIAISNILQDQVLNDNTKMRTDSINELRLYESESADGKFGFLSSYVKWFRNKYNRILVMNYLVCNSIVGYETTISIWNFKFNLNYFETFYHIVRVMLALELTYTTQYDYSKKQVIIAGGTFESLFWIEMLFRMGSFHSLGTYMRMTSKRIQLFINVSSLLLGVACGFRFTDTNPVAVCFIIIQILRFFRAYQFLDGFYTYEAMIPVFANVAFLMFSVVYFFSSFAHNRFCSALVLENSDVDDDSGAWAYFQNQLNFNTFAQSLYTLFQMAVLGSWNMVASTAAKKFPLSSFLFFYSYRLFMTLTVMPILFSFIIQIFIIRRDLEEQSKRTAPLPPEGSDDRKPQSVNPGGDSRGPSSSIIVTQDTDLSHDEAEDDVSSFINSMAVQHPDLGLKRSSFLRGDSVGSDNSTIMSKQSDKLRTVHQSRKKTRISAFSEDQEAEMMGTMWSSDPMLLKRRPPEVLENEIKKLKEHLSTAIQLLHDQKMKVLLQDQLDHGMREFIEGGLEPK